MLVPGSCPTTNPTQISNSDVSPTSLTLTEANMGLIVLAMSTPIRGLCLLFLLINANIHLDSERLVLTVGKVYALICIIASYDMTILVLLPWSPTSFSKATGGCQTTLPSEFHLSQYFS